MEPARLSTDTERPEAVPYFNWDVPVTNAQVRETLRDGSDSERLEWIARIMREARYEDVWRYLSLRRDVLALWERLAPRLGRKRRFWEFLLGEWRRAGLIQ